jgi:perosamine synthetase
VIMAKLQALGIGTRPGTHAVSGLGLYRNRMGIDSAEFSCAMACERNSIAIPLHNRMCPEDYQFVVEAFRAL